MIIQIKTDRRTIDFDRKNADVVVEFPTVTFEDGSKKGQIALFICSKLMLGIVSNNIDKLQEVYDKILNARAYNFTDSEDGVIVIETEEEI